MGKSVLASLIGLAFLQLGIAQDTTYKRTIDITSTFKPELREPAKILFNASPIAGDTLRAPLTYDIPAEQMLFTYQPASLKPLSLPAEAFPAWSNDNYIKVGLGNVHLPYALAGFSFGDGETSALNIFADHFNAKGALPFQRYSRTGIRGTASYRSPSDHEWSGSLGFRSEDVYLYGFRPDSLSFTKDDLLRRFQTFQGRIGLRNMSPGNMGVTYQPSLSARLFTDNGGPAATELNAVFDLPAAVPISDRISLRMGVKADFTRYRNPDLTEKSIINNIFLVSPALTLKTSSFFLQGGVIPSWDNGVFHLLPNIMADILTADERFTFQLGWIGRYDKGSYERFAGINPWLARPDSLRNTRVQEGYIGIRGATGNHLSYSAKIGFQQHKEIPLFYNRYMDGADGKSFGIVYEDKLNIFQMHAEGSYRIGNRLQTGAMFNWNIFKIQDEPRPWGLIPIELNASVRWEPLKHLYLRAELWTWDGAQYKGPDGESYKGEGAFDLNAGAEYRLHQNFSVWFQMNNIFNNRYERWHQYPVYGFNILGGIVYSFRP